VSNLWLRALQALTPHVGSPSTFLQGNKLTSLFSLYSRILVVDRG